jgi:outer membrane protein assembly factor BamB
MRRCPSCRISSDRASARWCGRCGAPLQESAAAVGDDRDVVVAVAAALGVAGIRWLPTGGADGSRAPNAGDLEGNDRVELPGELTDLPSASADNGVIDRRAAVLGPDAAGTLRSAWRTELDVPAGGLALTDDLVVAAAGEHVVGVDRATGTVRWRTRVGGQPLSAPITVQPASHRTPIVVVATAEGRVAALDGGSGRPRWGTDVGGTERQAPQLVGAGDAGVVVVHAGHVQAFDADGATLWERSGDAVTRGEVGEVVTVVAGERLFGVDTDDGTVGWERDVSAAARERPYTLGDVVAVRAGDELLALDASSGAVRWSRRPATDLRGAPFVAADTVVVGDADGAVAVDARGEEAWRVDTVDAGAVVDVSTAADGRRIAVVLDGPLRLRLVDARSGEQIASVVPSAWFASAAIDGDDLTVATLSPTRGAVVRYPLSAP